MIRSIRPLICKEQAKIITEAVVLSKLYYMCTIWTHATAKVLKPALKIFKDCINLVLGRHFSNVEYNDLKWLTLNENCNFKLMCLAFKVKLKMCPNVFKELLCDNAIRKYNTRSGSHEISTKSLCPDYLSYLITNAWAQTPQQFKQCDSYQSFKVNLKQWFIDKRIKSDIIGCDLSCIDKVVEESKNFL